MREIWIPELLSSLFMLVFLIRPLFKGLWPLDGIAWLPVLALGITLATFPAYGFRPECIPLLIHHGAVALMNLGALTAGTRRNTAFHETGGLFTASAIAALVLFTGAALWFAPRDLAPVRSRQVRVPSGRNGIPGPAYTLHIFEGEAAENIAGEGGNASGPRPLIFLVPPGFGGLGAVDSICTALGDRGFTVISYTRRNSGPPDRLFRNWGAFRRGTVLKKANDSGRALEAEKKAEIEFLIPYIKENLAALAPGADAASLFLAGWGAGGSALAYLAIPEQGGAGTTGAGNAGTAAGRFPGPGRTAAPAYGALGLVVVEGRLWSSWVPAPPPIPAALSPTPFFAFLGNLRNWMNRFRPAGIAGPRQVPLPEIPALYLVSDRALGREQAPYAAIFAGLRNSAVPAALAAMEGAGPLDYSDLPAEYPLYTTLFPGAGRAAVYDGDSGPVFPGRRRTPDSIGDTAALIARFCELTAAASPGASLPAGRGAPVDTIPRRRLHLETRYWNFGDLRLY